MRLSNQSVSNYNKTIFNAVYAWLMDENIRPQIVVDTKFPGITLPPHLYETPRQILSIDMVATHQFRVLDEGLEFNSRFSGKSFNCWIPWGSILAYPLNIDDKSVTAIPSHFIQHIEDAPGAAAGTATGETLAPTPPTPRLPIPSAEVEDTTGGVVVQMFGRQKK